jgi:hypothetical protein
MKKSDLEKAVENLSKPDRDRFAEEVRRYEYEARRQIEREMLDRLEYERQRMMMRAMPPVNSFSPLMPPPSFAALGGDFPPMVKPAPVDMEKLDKLKDAEPHKVQKKAPDYVHVLTGWRAWKIAGSKDGMKLKAIGASQNHIWEPRTQLEAVCNSKGDHAAPGFNCQCGVWAFKELDGLISALGSYHDLKVLGQVSLWGRVVETKNGYRAEKAYPAELWLFDSSLEELGLIYDVPVRSL